MHKGFSEEGQLVRIPNSYKDAQKSPQCGDWNNAIQKEMDSPRKHNVYKLVKMSSVPKEENIMGSRFVFKQKVDGRFKARLVVQGYVQEAGVDYGRSYAPVCRIGSIRTVLAIACEHGWPVWQMDVVVAFLQAHIDKDVYVKPARLRPGEPRHHPDRLRREPPRTLRDAKRECRAHTGIRTRAIIRAAGGQTTWSARNQALPVYHGQPALSRPMHEVRPVLRGAPISFGAKTQSLTAQSTVESELQALSYGAREAVYLSNFLTELGLKDSSQVPIRSDSTGALSVAEISMFSARTKHIALRYFFVRELVKKNKTTLHYTPTRQMLADIATKHLSKHTFRDLLQQINNFTS